MTHPTMIADPVLPRLVAGLRAYYGPRLERVVLFGSRARGDFRPDSDYDVAVFLHDYRYMWVELHPLAEMTTDILEDSGEVISAKPCPAGAWRERTAFMREVRRDGIDL
jgi:predicted nucleotidyltransferase